MYGRAKAPVTATARELRSTERLVKTVMPVSFPVHTREPKGRVLVVVSRAYYRAIGGRAQMLIGGDRLGLSKP
jgi:hypothetical protein